MDRFFSFVEEHRACEVNSEVVGSQEPSGATEGAVKHVWSTTAYLLFST